MFTKNLVRVLGCVVGVSSLVIACAPDDGASVTTKGGLEAECNPLLDRSCTPTIPGINVDSKDDPKTTTPTTGGKGGTTSSVVYSVCASALFVNPDFLDNPSGEQIPGYQRIVEFDDVTGTVPCLDRELGTAVDGGCKLNTAIAKNHKWTVFGAKGGVNGKRTFVRSGLSINRDGSLSEGEDMKGNKFQYGEFILGARAKPIVDRKTQAVVRYEVACLPPSGKDAVGTLAAADLAAEYVVERMQSAENAAVEEDGVTRKKHINYAENCCATKNSDAELPGTPKSGAIFCWKGNGAGLNDPNGLERNSSDVYYPEPDRSHVVINLGIETPAAKRVPSAGNKFLENYPQKWMLPSPYSYGN